MEDRHPTRIPEGGVGIVIHFPFRICSKERMSQANFVFLPGYGTLDSVFSYLAGLVETAFEESQCRIDDRQFFLLIRYIDEYTNNHVLRHSWSLLSLLRDDTESNIG